MNLKARKMLSLSEFLGVDLSSSAFDVNKQRAVESYNFINENGTNKKRNGWIEKVNFENAKINGIYPVKLNNQEFFIVHAGNKIYNVQLGVNSVESTYSCISENLKITDSRSMGFVNKNSLYILCGNFLVFSKVGNQYILREVYNDSDTYIPVTTIGIENIEEAEQKRQTFEPLNMLNAKRKNKAKGKTETVTLQLDAVNIDKTEVVVDIETTDSNGVIITHHLVNDVNISKFILNGTEVGSINFEKGQITLTLDTHIPNAETSKDDNIVVTFSKASEEYKKIAGCTFGTVFGNGGNGNRLFVSGNEDYKNLDWFSGYGTGGDYTYFTSISVCAYGSDNVRNIAYTRLGDGTLALHKENTNIEPTIYYRTFSIEQSTSNSSLNKPIAPVSAGNIGVGAISKFATGNLNGDNIILTSTGLYGVVLASNIATNERLIRERSRYINERLLKENKDVLANSVMYTLNDKLYLKVGDLCYVASSRYKSRLKDDYSDTFNYEFWVWKNVPAYTFAEYSGDLIFGTESGSVCFFDNRYTDRSYIKISEGDIGFIDNTTLLFNRAMDYMERLKEGDLISLKNGSNKCFVTVVELSEIEKVEGNKVFVTESALKKIYNGMEVYINNQLYTIRKVDKGEISFELENVNEINIQAAIKTDVSDKTLKIINYNNEGTFNVSFKHLNIPLKIDTFTNPHGFINIVENVKCSWKTPIFDLSTNISTKKLQSITLTSEAKVGGQVKFGYKTANQNVSMLARGVQLFDFNNIDFTNFSFETRGFPKSYQVRPLARDFNYIQFNFESENDGDCSINSINIEFTELRRYKGVR